MKLTKTLIVATLGMAMFAGAAYAQYKATGDDGITASPKLREMITARDGVSAAPTIAPDHRCPMCKDEYATRADQTAKGVIKPVILVSKHLCAGCETTLSQTGQGKTAQNVVTHKCTSGLASCCAPKN